ncbi:uncharacterized protein BDR25DRAFT_311809 [Lindgomyces ingoldianus]|uniref:Uncharacterized protein n=1 Tax=Lindgomyces ingoldianus TaxID=673940 RepID=A0ACB6R329_9PLEO|nr:uncharacterized protein BDR25DRAFT_311809 [Lindgomyces ingoldianus]KAF2473581.1 hypothetical protein BDR25DRAFT_311809 [Lindgomyces ingoldianus]
MLQLRGKRHKLGQISSYSLISEAPITLNLSLCRSFTSLLTPHVSVSSKRRTPMAFLSLKRRRQVTQSFDYLLKDSWFPEVQSIFTAWLALVMVFFLLGYYFNKAPFTWHGLSLNTWVSIFSTVMKSLLLFTVSACLSQWKYISFSQRKRKLIDFDLYDGASRGPNGSVSLLWSMQFRSLASIGAVITILSLAIDPFVQQVIGLGQIQTPDNSTSIPFAIRYAKGTQHSLNNRASEVSYVPTIDFSLQSAIMAGLSEPKDTILQQTEFRCSGTQCSWKPFLSLGVCSSCADITGNLTQKWVSLGHNRSLQGAEFAFNKVKNLTATTPVNTFSLPNGLYIEDYKDYFIDMVTYGTSNRSKTIAFQKNDTLLYALTIIHRLNRNQPGGLSDFKAMECGLSYCVQNITSKVVNASLTENVVVLPVVLSDGSSQPVSTDTPNPSSGSLWTPYLYPRTDLQLMANNTGFNITQAALNSIGYFMNSTFVKSGGRTLGATGFYIKSPPQQEKGQDQGGDQGTDSSTDSGPQFQPAAMQQIFTMNITAMFESVATSMSINFRTNDEYRNVLLGSTAVTVYKVRWGWIALPVVSVLGGTGFLFITIFYSYQHRLPLWKSSSLSVLKCGAQMGDILKDEETVSDMEDKAENTYIGLMDEKKSLLADSDSTRGLRSSENFEMTTYNSDLPPRLPNIRSSDVSFISLPSNEDLLSEDMSRRLSWEEEDDLGRISYRP